MTESGLNRQFADQFAALTVLRGGKYFSFIGRVTQGEEEREQKK